MKDSFKADRRTNGEIEAEVDKLLDRPASTSIVVELCSIINELLSERQP